MNNKEKIKIKKAKLEDAKQICALINKYSKKGLMLYRPVSEIEYKIRDYFVCRIDDKVIGCVAFRIWNKKSSEIYALAVDSNYAGKGIGSKLIESCLIDAKNIGVNFVFTLTFRDSMFAKIGFKKIGISRLPKVIFTEKTVDVDKAYGIEIK